MYNVAGTEKMIGHKLNRNIYSHNGSLLISAFTFLTDEHIRYLVQHKICLSTDDLEPVENRSKELIESAVSEVKGIFETASRSEWIHIEKVERDLVPRITELANSPRLFSLLMKLQELDDYTYRHNVAVGIISTLIGKWLGYDEKTLYLLSLSATLHDIGKVKIPTHILKKPGKLSFDEYSLMKKHTIYGYEMIRNSYKATGCIAYVALQHHEREDGSGYPFGAKGTDLNPLSKIVAVADVFHAMASKRVYKNSTPFYLVLKQMMDNAFGFFDPFIVMTFMQKIMESLLGCTASLSDGRQGIIVLVHRDSPVTPLIRIGNGYVNLKTEPYLHIESIL
jgi:HD-GYP domain-containing protein (c-di-GMP phosphodiesterase class II)